MISLQDLIKSNIRIVQIVSHEDLIIQAMVDTAANHLQRKWFRWNNAKGLLEFQRHTKSFKESEIKGTQDIHYILDEWINSDEAENSIIIIEEWRGVDNQEDIYITNILKEFFYYGPKSTAIVISSHNDYLPSSLGKKVYKLDMTLPNENILDLTFKSVCKKRNFDEKIDAALKDNIIKASLGLTTLDAERAYNLMITNNIKNGRGFVQENLDEIIEAKEQVIRNSGYLEYYHHKETFNDIGGSQILKQWLRQRQKAFSEEAKKFGLPTPRGLLLVGIPGTGKSLFAKSIGQAFGQPIIRMDIGKVFGGFVGESENNMRNALKIIETVAPAVLWIDEIEKGMSGIASSNRSDGGTTARVLGTFLTWMQEKKAPVFVVATANNVSELPPEFLRKGRFDEIFFLDLPDIDERKEIFKIHIAKNNRNPENFDIKKLATYSKNFSGAEIEEAVKEALFMAYDNNEDINTSYVQQALENTYPLADTMKEKIDALRQWANNRAVYASGKRE